MRRLLSDDFLSMYYKKGDVFPDLLARSVYLSKYCRGGETWTDTVKRVVLGNMACDTSSTTEEAESLFDAIWRMQCLPPGRGLWTGGVPNIPADAVYNCYYTTIEDPEEWAWVSNQLMLGGGVGVGLQNIHMLPYISSPNQSSLEIFCLRSHPDVAEFSECPHVVLIDNKSISERMFAIELEDSREGWVKGFKHVIKAAFLGLSVRVDISNIRCRGSALKTFGGIASGPAPLVHLLSSVYSIIRGAAGRSLTTVEALDITNHIGLCVKSGNVRRSALICLANTDAQDFREAKKDWDKVRELRHTSNNSIIFKEGFNFEGFDWDQLADDNLNFGEPGFLNLDLIRKTDRVAKGVNPCGEIPLEDREACNLAEVFPAKVDNNKDMRKILKLISRYALRQRMHTMLDPKADEVRKRNMRVGVGLGGICNFEWKPSTLASWHETVREECSSYARHLGVNRPIATTTVKPSGTISLLNGSSPGIHAPYAEYYIRRINLATNDPLVPALKEAGVPSAYSVYDKKGKTLVFEFPMKSKFAGVTVKTETLRDQLERQVSVQNSWADNAVSATITFDPNKPKELALAMKEFAPKLKSCSFLGSYHAYEQAPYEEIDENTYVELIRTIDTHSPLVRGSEMEIQECEGGVCPTR